MTPAESSFYVHLGRRMAERRKELGITQVQLAETLGIAQQTLAHYEGGKVRIAAAALPVIADALSLPIDALISASTSHKQGSGKRGPKPRIQQQLEQLSKLPKTKQRAVEQILESVLSSAA